MKTNKTKTSMKVVKQECERLRAQLEEWKTVATLFSESSNKSEWRAAKEAYDKLNISPQ